MSDCTVRVRILVAVDSCGDWAGVGASDRDREYCEQWIGPRGRRPFAYHWIEADVPRPTAETMIAGEVKDDAA